MEEKYHYDVLAKTVVKE